jgi:hypothetical protein
MSGVAFTLDFKGCQGYEVNDDDTINFTDANGKAHYANCNYHIAEE